MENYDVAFQEGLVAALWSDGKFLSEWSDTIGPSFFSDEIVQGVWKSLVRFLERERSVPGLGAITEELKSGVAPGRKYGEYVEKVKAIHARIGENTGFYLEHVARFAKRQAIKRALARSEQLLENEDFDGIASEVQRAFRVGQQGQSAYYDLLKNAKERAIQYYRGDEMDRRRRVGTGIGPIDEVMKGGLGPGELGVILALAKHGKSSMLVNFGVNALMAGKQVLHVSLENSRPLVSSRYDTRIYGKSVDDICKTPKRFWERMKELSDTLKTTLEIVYFPTKTLTPQHLSTVIAGATKPDVVMLDFADLMRCPTRDDARRFELAGLYTDIRRVAGECQVPIWTASQANRPAFGAKVIGMDNFSECFEKAGIMDVGISVNQDDDQAARGELILALMGSRIGRSGILVDCKVDWETAMVRAYTAEEGDVS